MESIHIETNRDSDYALLDSGNRQKLERVGEIAIIRSEPRAWWQPHLPQAEWDKAVATYAREEKGSWETDGELPEDFTISLGDLRARVKFTSNSKHIGFFPEQSGQWAWIEEKLKGRDKPKVLNLFGYTGLASLAAARAGAEVTHVDASRAAIGWARENQTLSGLESAPIRWILDDAIDYLKREVKRGVKYDGIIMDPPAYGKGPKGQVWKAENEVPVLLDLCRQVLSDNPLFMIMNMYSTELSSISLANLLSDATRDLGGRITPQEFALREEGSDRLLPLSISATWEK